MKKVLLILRPGLQESFADKKLVTAASIAPVPEEENTTTGFFV